MPSNLAARELQTMGERQALLQKLPVVISTFLSLLDDSSITARPAARPITRTTTDDATSVASGWAGTSVFTDPVSGRTSLPAASARGQLPPLHGSASTASVPGPALGASQSLSLPQLSRVGIRSVLAGFDPDSDSTEYETDTEGEEEDSGDEAAAVGRARSPVDRRFYGELSAESTALRAAVMAGVAEGDEEGEEEEEEEEEEDVGEFSMGSDSAFSP